MDLQTGTVVDHEALARLLRPRTIAVVGINDASSWRERAHATLHSDAEVFFVNPDREAVFGRRTHPSLSSIGRPIDAVMSVMPDEPTTALIERAARLDIGGLVAVGGNASGTGTAARALQSRMKAVVRKKGIPLIGPKSLGFVNVPQRINLTAAMSCWARPGGISIVSQSDALLNRLAGAGDRAGYGYNLLISAGSETVTDLADYVEFLAADPDTRAIALIVQTIRRPEVFFAAAQRAAEAGKPVAMLKLARGDRSPGSSEPDPAENLWMLDIALRQSGITVVADLRELLDYLVKADPTSSCRAPLRPIPAAAVAGVGSSADTGTPGPSMFSGRRNCPYPDEAPSTLPQPGRMSRPDPRSFMTFPRARKTFRRETPPPVAALPRPQASTMPLPGGRLLPFEATMEVLKGAGIPVAPYHVLRDDDDPMAVRMLFPGPYALRLADTRDLQARIAAREDVPAEELASAVTGLRAVATEYYVPPVVVVQPYLEVLAQCFVGLLPNSELGSTVIFGTGGSVAEKAPVGGRMAPLSLQDARSLIYEFDEVAGDGWDDREREELAGILTAAGRLAVAARGWMRSLDVNTLACTKSGLLVTDAFCLLHEDHR
ncbi:CoA-binding protein [Nonomuraea sp. NPDC049649]|uniref:CoA-binding protein n=1 Tax=Nonomuraea sp. NPDC049649 TaxID=3155776 RepID=UPI00341B71D8